jgi:hypothetical protein
MATKKKAAAKKVGDDVKQYMFQKGPGGLMDMETIVLLGFLLIDGKLAKSTLMGGSLPQKFQALLAGEMGASPARIQMKNRWETVELGSHLPISLVLRFAQKYSKELDSLRQGLVSMATEQLGDDYSECVFSADMLLQLFEAGRIVRWRTLDE